MKQLDSKLIDIKDGLLKELHFRQKEIESIEEKIAQIMPLKEVKNIDFVKKFTKYISLTSSHNRKKNENLLNIEVNYKAKNGYYLTKDQIEIYRLYTFINSNSYLRFAGIIDPPCLVEYKYKETYTSLGETKEL